MKRIIETLLTNGSTRSTLKRLIVGLAVSAAVVIGSGLTANAAPANDNFANAIDLPGATGTQSGTDTIDATLQAGEPNPGATNTVWFKWTCPETGKLTVDTFGSADLLAGEWDAILGIYSGAALNALTPLGDTPKDTGYQETMTVPVTAGTTYYIQLAGYANTPAANIVVNWTLDNLDNGAQIVTFGANVTGSSAVITATSPTAGTVAWTVPFGTAMATLAPTFTLSPLATCNQTNGAVPTPNFTTSPVHYIVTAGGGTATRDYSVTVTVAPPSMACDMLTFGANVAGSVAVITPGTVDWYLPYGTAVAALAPTLTISFAATCLPTSGTTKNFTSPQTYTVTAQDGTTAQSYIVTARVATESALVWSAGGGGDWDFTNPNWIGQTTSTPQPFANAYNVIFDATGVGGTINIPSAVFPLSTTVTNDSPVNYKFSGGLIAMGSLMKSGSGTLAIDGLVSDSGTVVANTYSGGTIVNGGTLHLGGMYAGLSPLCTGTVGTGPVTLNGGTIRFDRITETNALISNGGTIASDNGWGASWNGPVTLNAILTSAAASGNAGTVTLGGAISGTGGLLKTGFNTLTLSGVNNYSGPTTVTAGTLQCNNPDALGNGGTLTISGSGKVNLNYTGEHNVAILSLGGVAQTSGTYGSSASPAANKNDTYFTGTGVVRVPLSSFKDILTFSFGVLGNAAIVGTNITLVVPPGTDRTSLAPTYTVSPGAAGSPLSGTPHNFTIQQTYTVTAENGSTQAYRVMVSEAVLPDIFTWINAGSGNWSIAANWINELASGEAPVGGGRPSYTFNFNTAGTYSVTNDLNSGYQLNQLNLGGPVLTLAGNSLAFTANGATLPQLNQNSAAGCTISVPLSLATNTTVGGTGTASLTFNGALSGPGSLTKTNSGTLQINGAPSHTGGTHVTAGTLFLFAAETGFAPNAAAFNIAPVTVESGATLEGYRAHLVGNLTMNGGRYFEYNGWNDGGWWGPIYLAADSFFGRSTAWCYALTLGGVISGPGGFTYDSYNNNQPPLTLSSANTYTGPTIVNSGKVVCKDQASLGNFGALTINSPGVVNLNYTGTHFVSALTLDGTPMSRGVYGSSSSGAPIQDDTHFDTAGTGTVTVPGPAEIVAFTAAGRAGVIDQTTSTINVTVPYGTELATLAPTFTLSSGTCIPASGTRPTPSFAALNPATYTVIDGTTTTTYLVTVTVAPPPILVGNSGAGPLTFDALPPVAEWSTFSVAGGAGDVTTDGGIDSVMSGINASSIIGELYSQANNTAYGLAIWRSDTLKLYTRPTGNKITLLMATLMNVSGSTIDTLAVSYTLGAENAATEQILGYRVYWSKTGAPGSWTTLGDATLATAGSKSVESKLPGIAWANGQTLYVVWADDNGDNTEGRYSIDDVSFTKVAAPPTPTLPPGSFSIAPGWVPTFTNVPTTAGYTYWLTYKNNLADATWTRIGAGTAGGGNKTFADTVTPYPASRFYRLEVQ
jgi:autotransporter-associated beta strand protein